MLIRIFFYVALFQTTRMVETELYNHQNRLEFLAQYTNTCSKSGIETQEKYVQG